MWYFLKHNYSGEQGNILEYGFISVYVYGTLQMPPQVSKVQSFLQRTVPGVLTSSLAQPTTEDNTGSYWTNTKNKVCTSQLCFCIVLTLLLA